MLPLHRESARDHRRKRGDDWIGRAGLPATSSPAMRETDPEVDGAPRCGDAAPANGEASPS
jgi:hypothetical protein